MSEEAMEAGSGPKFIKDKQRRINIKSKRRRNFFKKAIELKNMCGLEMLVVIKDAEYNRVHVYQMMDMATQADWSLMQTILSEKSKGNPIVKADQ